jgi:hypothetical protein
VVLHDLSNVLHPAGPVRVELDPLGWATVSVAVVEHLGTKGKVACPGLVDKYLSSQGILETRVDSSEGSGWTYTVMSKCSGTLGLWIAHNVAVKDVQVGLIGENRAPDTARGSELETMDLGKGKGKWISVELNGKSKVIFQLE